MRTAALFGEDAVEGLTTKKVAVFGVGGVGGFCVEAMARAGVGSFVLVDSDEVALSNINRQIIALHSTVGRKKVEVMSERIADINPEAVVETRPCFFLPENAAEFDFSDYDYVVDAVDTVTAKIAIIEAAKKADVPVISAMGAGNKLDPTRFEVADIAKTEVCPLAKVMRRELKKRDITNVKVVFSREEAPRAKNEEKIKDGSRPAPGSLSFVPSVMGLIMAGEVIKDLVK